MTEAPADRIRLRIVDQGMIDPRELRANPLNWRLHPPEQMDVLDAVLDEVGIVDRVALINVRHVEDGWAPEDAVETMIDGHARVERALAKGQGAVPYTRVRLTPNEEAIVLRTYDPIGAMAQQDDEKLAEVSSLIEAEGDLRDVLDRLDAEAGLEIENESSGAGGGGSSDDYEHDDEKDPDPSKAELLRQKWGVEPGHLWRIPAGFNKVGAHVVLCADARKEESWARLMRGAKADCIWVDPPFGVDYQNAVTPLDAARGKRRTDGAEVLGDAQPEDELATMLDEMFFNAGMNAQICTPFYVKHPPGPIHLIFAGSIQSANWVIHQTLIWKKDAFVLGRSDYHYRHEPIYYGWTGGKLPGGVHRWSKNLPNGGKYSRWFGGDDQDTVFEIDRPKRSLEHPTMTPPALPMRHIENSTRHEQIVVDFCCGSGPVLTACEELGRYAYLMDLDPASVAVTLERASLLGLKPEKVDPVTEW